MIRLAADENLNHDILRGLLRRDPQIDFITVQEAGLSGAEDSAVLSWAAETDRVLLTHDVQTLVSIAISRVATGQAMPGVIAIPLTLPVRLAIDDLVLLAGASFAGEWEKQILFLPLK
jgi:predicted nuclease of predicted toxin-antitoxin system